MGRLIVLAGVTGLLWGCAAQIAERDRNTCLGYGAQPGTDTFVNCMIQQDARRQAAVQAFGANLQQIEAERTAVQNAAAAQAAARRPIQCQSVQNGRTTDTTCY